MVFPHIVNNDPGMYALSEQVTISTLTSAVTFVLPEYARGILVQPYTEDVHVTFGSSTVVATTAHFRLSTAMVSMVFLPIGGGQTISFIENLAGATLSYIIVR